MNRANVMDRTASPWKEAMTAARKGESGRENVNSRCRPAKRMKTALAEELGKAHRVGVEVLLADLSIEEGISRVERRVAELPVLDLLVNNAGFGGRGGFAKGDVSDHMTMVKVNPPILST